MKVHYSAKTPEWSTPPDFYADLHREFGFTLDPCCTHDNAKCARHFTAADDGLAHDWTRDNVFMNPPYGRVIGAWMRKAYDSSRAGATVVCLVPSRTDTRWWHDYAMRGEVRFVKGRLKFGGGEGERALPVRRCGVPAGLPAMIA